MYCRIFKLSHFLISNVSELLLLPDCGESFAALSVGLCICVERGKCDQSKDHGTYSGYIGSNTVSSVNDIHIFLFLHLNEYFRPSRFLWNFIRLENEHLNNCGRFRAVRDISITVIEQPYRGSIATISELPAKSVHTWKSRAKLKILNDSKKVVNVV